MNISQRFFSLFLLTLPFGPVQAASELGLREIVEFGLKNAPQFQKSRNDLAVGELNLEVASSKFLPSLDLTAVQGYQDGDPIYRTLFFALKRSSEPTLQLRNQYYYMSFVFVDFKLKLFKSRNKKCFKT